MAGLTDMEELLGRVTNPEINNYLREAFVCYGAGAYRACIVLTANALFEDLRQKTKAVALVNSDAKTISAEIEKIAADQKVFETTLTERLVAKGILSKVQGDRIKQISGHRNKAAHPSGVHASAEEARWVFFEAIDKFVSQPVLSANQMVDQLVNRLGDSNYFPDSNVSNILDITDDELKHLHPLAFPYLIHKLLDLVISSDPSAEKNGRFFLSGCAMIKSEDLRAALGKQFLKPKASDNAFGSTLMSVVSADPALFSQADATTKLRLNTLFSEIVAKKLAVAKSTPLGHPALLLGNLVASLKQDEILPALEKFVDATIAKYYANPMITQALQKPGTVREKVVAEILSRAGSSNFDTANSFASNASDLDAGLASQFDGKEALKLIGSISYAADCGAFTAKDLVKNDFSGLPLIKAMALKYLKDKPKSSASALKSVRLDISAKEFSEQYLSDSEDID